jgi:hypothetical protein
VVDPDPGDRLRRWRPVPVKFPDTQGGPWVVRTS